ncbi:hypothetical protein G4B88_021769 [Cannabis sativa]|uniref:Ubiquitin-like protease family profile domain-containing protein n=1 Tax=Cannabis sativa TaxID=3483 RepID=A0A7J6EYZ7_CANSA|nr:hypothetical protein G4B88_021769 [Cannabis sativa]
MNKGVKKYSHFKHLDVVFYYLRNKIKQDDTLNKRITTTNCLFDQYLDVYSSRDDLNLVEGPYSIRKRESLNYKFIEGLSSQVNNDCGVFVIKFADLFIHKRIADISSKMADMVARYRDDLVVSLFIHARRK